MQQTLRQNSRRDVDLETGARHFRAFNALPWVFCALIFASVLYSCSLTWAQTRRAELKESGVISGRVMCGDEPLPGILVMAFSTGREVGRSRSDANGYYRIEGLSAGRVTLNLAAPTFVLISSLFSFEGTQVNLRAGETVEGIDFKLSRGGVITGRVTDADDRPVIGERLEVQRVDEKGNPTGPEFQSNVWHQMYDTDDRGVFRIYSLAAGHYKLKIGAESGYRSFDGLGSYPVTYYGDTSDQAKASIINLNEGAEERKIDIHLGRRRRTYNVRGRVIDADKGEPIEGTRIALGLVESRSDYIGSWMSPNTPTDSQGRFTLSGVEPGRHAVFVQPNRAGMAEDTPHANVFSDPIYFEITDSDVTDLEIKAQRATMVSGQVTPENIKDPNALNKLFRLNILSDVVAMPGSRPRPSLGHLSTRIRPDGSFQIEGLPPGKLTLNLSRGEVDTAGFGISRIEYAGANQSEGIEIRAGQSVSGVLIYVTYGTARIRGQVIVEGGAFPENLRVYVQASREGTRIQQTALADKRGAFVIDNLPAGSYQVNADFSFFETANGRSTMSAIPSQRQTVTLTNSGEAEVVFTLNSNQTKQP